jgi:fluoride ion exporter CrcB/FEX
MQDDEQSPPSGPSEPPPPISPPARTWTDFFHTVSWITIFSTLGTLTRLALVLGNTYPGNLVSPLVWAQFVGCSFLGFFVTEKHVFSRESKKTEALYLGITVGYCGSTTSFSGWMSHIFEEISNFRGYPRNSGYNIISVITEIMITVASSFFGFYVGTHVSAAWNSFPIPKFPEMRGTMITIFVSLLAIGVQSGTIAVSAIREDWRAVGFGLVFSPLGAFCRWRLSHYLNSRNSKFPIGTFAANLSGSLLSAIFFLLQFYTTDVTGCELLTGFRSGFCGSLTTVSTFISELSKVPLRSGYIYGCVSIFFGILFFVLVDGINYWLDRGLYCVPL